MSPSPDGTDNQPGENPPLPNHLREARVIAPVPALRRYAHSLSRNTSDGEDLPQDCLEKAFARRTTWRGGNLESWLMTIMTNLDRNRRRSDPQPSAFVDISQAGSVPSTAIAGDPLDAYRLRTASDLRPPDQRAIPILVVVKGHACTELAAIMDVPLGTVMSPLSGARRRFADISRGHSFVPLRRV